MKKVKRYSLVLVFAMIGFTGISFVTDNHGKYFEIAKNIEIFTNLYKEINTYYVDEVEPAKLMRTGVDAMLESLDPYTNYISESEIEGFKYMIDGKYGGIGADTKEVDGKITITFSHEGLPADEGGLKVGDHILSVDGKSTEGKSSDDVKDILRGSPGSVVEVIVKRPGVAKEIKASLTREEVKVPNVPYFGMVSNDVGYATLTTFTQDAGKNVANAVKELKKENPGIKGIILDLRGNGGGLLREAINVCNVFIPKGQEVVVTRSRVKDWDRSFRTLNAPVDEEIKLVVLIDNNSASASEIVSGVIQDLDRGVLMGQQSYGKGLVQNTKDVGYNSKVKLTTAKYYIPSGRCIQAVSYKDGEPVDVPTSERNVFKTNNGRKVYDGGGVKPDVVLKDPNLSNVLKGLNKEHLIFKYATDYSLKKETLAKPEEYKFNDFSGFMNFVAKESFSFDTDTERMLNDLKEKANEDGYYDIVQGDIKAIKDKILQSKKNDLKKYQNEITQHIEREIVGRYHYQKGQIAISLKNDTEIKEAVKMINDAAKYEGLLK